MIKPIYKQTFNPVPSPQSPAIPEINQEDIREIIFGSYRIVYLVSNGEVNILTVFHSSRQLKL